MKNRVPTVMSDWCGICKIVTTEVETLYMDLLEALETGNQEHLLQIPKSDIHSHGGRGGNISFISQKQTRFVVG